MKRETSTRGDEFTHKGKRYVVACKQNWSGQDEDTISAFAKGKDGRLSMVGYVYGEDISDLHRQLEAEKKIKRDLRPIRKKPEFPSDGEFTYKGEKYVVGKLVGAKTGHPLGLAGVFKCMRDKTIGDDNFEQYVHVATIKDNPKWRGERGTFAAEKAAIKELSKTKR